jgi:hypothetical protein
MRGDTKRRNRAALQQVQLATGEGNLDIDRPALCRLKPGAKPGHLAHLRLTQ